MEKLPYCFGLFPSGGHRYSDPRQFPVFFSKFFQLLAPTNTDTKGPSVPSFRGRFSQLPGGLRLVDPNHLILPTMTSCDLLHLVQTTATAAPGQGRNGTDVLPGVPHMGQRHDNSFVCLFNTPGARIKFSLPCGPALPVSSRLGGQEDLWRMLQTPRDKFPKKNIPNPNNAGAVRPYRRPD